MKPSAILALGTLVFAGASPSSAQSEAWVTRLGNDTVAVERYSRTKDRLEGDFVTVSPRTRTNHYVVRFGPDGRVVSYEMTATTVVDAQGAAPPLNAALEFSPTEVRGTIRRGEKTDTVRLEGANVVPFAFFSWGLLGLSIEAVVASGRDSASVLQYSVGAPRLNQAAVKRMGDSMAVDFFGNPLMVRADNKGRILGVSGSQTTLKVVATRVGDLDLARVTEQFAARDRTGQSTGQLSTRDTITTTVGGAEISIDYGRPAKRGRDIWGSVVPYDVIWRTGANAATQFTTSKTLELSGLTIPAGTYTLWTLPTKDGMKLIVNKQTKQWGTQYDPAQDLGRVDAQVTQLGSPTERFTISVEPSGNAGELRLEWDRLRYSVPFTVKG